MDQKERRKLLGLLLINSGVFYIKKTNKEKKRHTGRSCWIKEWLIKRDSLKELHLNDQEYFISSSLLYIIVKKVFQEINNGNLFH